MGGWLSQHLKEWVAPRWGFEIKALPKNYVKFFSPEEMSVIKNMWRAVKSSAQGSPILLAGRDVWVFEVLARREGWPTTFRPEFSRLTIDLVNKEVFKNHFVFDTGFVGSIPMGLGINKFTMASSNKGGAVGINFFGRRVIQPLKEETHQVFPRLRGARSLALKIERTPKYWRRGYNAFHIVTNYGSGFVEAICQDLSDKQEALKATYLTIEVYTDNSPRLSKSTLTAVKIPTGTGYLE